MADGSSTSVLREVLRNQQSDVKSERPERETERGVCRIRKRSSIAEGYRTVGCGSVVYTRLNRDPRYKWYLMTTAQVLPEQDFEMNNYILEFTKSNSNIKKCRLDRVTKPNSIYRAAPGLVLIRLNTPSRWKRLFRKHLCIKTHQPFEVGRQKSCDDSFCHVVNDGHTNTFDVKSYKLRQGGQHSLQMKRMSDFSSTHDPRGAVILECSGAELKAVGVLHFVGDEISPIWLSETALFVGQFPPEQQQGTNTPLEQQQGTDAPPEQQQGTNTPLEQQQGTDAPSEQQQGTNAPTEQQQGTNAPPEQQQGTNAPPEQQQGTNAPPEQQQGTNAPPEQQQGTNAPPEQQQGTNAPPEQQQGTNAPPEQEPGRDQEDAIASESSHLYSPQSLEQDHNEGSPPGPVMPQNQKLNVVLATDKWDKSVNGKLANQMAQDTRLKVSGLVPESSQRQKEEVAKGSNIELVDAKKLTGYRPIDRLAYPPDTLHIDVLIMHSVGRDLGRQAQVIKDSKKCMWVHVLHTVDEELEKYIDSCNSGSRSDEDPPEHEIQKLLCEKADLIIAIGPKVAQEFKSALQFCGKSKDVITLTPGMFEEFSGARKLVEGGEMFRVLINGSSEYYTVKGCDIAAKAIQLLDSSFYQLVFVKQPKDSVEELKQKLLRDGVHSNQLSIVTIESQTTWSQLLCKVDLVIKPSRVEGFGLSGLRAISAALPVLVSRNCGLGEVLKTLHSGPRNVVESDEPQDWADKIKELRDQGSETRRLEAQQLRAEYGKHFSWKNQCDQLVEKLLKMVPLRQFGIQCVADNPTLMNQLAWCLDKEYRVLMYWPHLAEKLNVPHDVRLGFQVFTDLSPTVHLFQFLSTVAPQMTVEKLKMELKSISRNDLVSDLKDIPDSETVTAVFDEKPKLLDSIALKLDTAKRPVGNWKTLAGKLLTGPQLKKFEDQVSSPHNPAAVLFRYLSKRGTHCKLTVGDLKEKLQAMSREDVLQVLKNNQCLKDTELLTDVLQPDSDLLSAVTSLLNKKILGADNWRKLANILGVSPALYEDFDPQVNSNRRSPMKRMLEWLKSEHPDMTVDQLRNALREIDRADAVEILDGYTYRASASKGNEASFGQRSVTSRSFKTWSPAQEF